MKDYLRQNSVADEQSSAQRSVPRLFEKQAARTPNAPAVICGEQRLSYAELNHRADRLARRLRDTGVKTETAVGLLLERSFEMIVAMLAALKAGGAYVPLDAASPAERMAFVLADCDARVVLTERKFLSKLPATNATNATVICLDDFDSAENFEASISRDVGCDDCEENFANTANATRVKSESENLAYVIYTSGSTGKPKGVAVPHRAISSLVRETDYAQLRADDVVAQAASCAFDAATFEIWGVLLNGARLVILPQDAVLSPRRLVDEIARHGITAMFLTTALFNQVAREIPGGFRPLRHLLFGGEACDPKLIARVLEAGAPQRLLHVYGPTETTTFATWHEVKSVSPNATTVPIGKAIARAEALVLDEHLQPVAQGETGELFIGGAGVARGYIKQPELTNARFISIRRGEENSANAARFYKTGDLVRVNARGEIEFVGRTDFQVKIRGFRIELPEIESALKTHPLVREAVVLVREDFPGDKRLAAYIAQNENAAATKFSAADARNFLREKLPDYMIPTAFVTLDIFPLNANGKIDRRALAALPAPQNANAAHDFSANENPQQLTAPRSEIEHLIFDAWRETLRTDAIGADDNFFDLGGNSLHLAAVHATLEKSTAQKIPITDLFKFPTARTLAAHLSGMRANAAPANPFLDRAKMQRERLAGLRARAAAAAQNAP